MANPHEDPLDVDSRYWSLKESLIQTELFIMRVLSFRVIVEHPHKVGYVLMTFSSFSK